MAEKDIRQQGGSRQEHAQVFVNNRPVSIEESNPTVEQVIRKAGQDPENCTVYRLSNQNDRNGEEIELNESLDLGQNQSIYLRCDVSGGGFGRGGAKMPEGTESESVKGLKEEFEGEDETRTGTGGGSNMGGGTGGGRGGSGGSNKGGSSGGSNIGGSTGGRGGNYGERGASTPAGGSTTGGYGSTNVGGSKIGGTGGHQYGSSQQTGVGSRAQEPSGGRSGGNFAGSSTEGKEKKDWEREGSTTGTDTQQKKRNENR